MLRVSSGPAEGFLRPDNTRRPLKSSRWSAFLLDLRSPRCEMPARGRCRMVLPERERRRRSPRPARLGREAAVARRAPVPSDRPERTGHPDAVRAPRGPVADDAVDEPDHADPLQAEGGVFAAASPEDEAVARHEALGDPGQGLRRLEGDAFHRRAVVRPDPQSDVPSRSDLGRAPDGPPEARAEVRPQRVPRAPDEMVAASLVRPEEGPSVDRFRADRPAGAEHWPRPGRAESKEDRAGGVGRHEEPTGPRIVAEEQSGIPTGGLSNAYRVHAAGLAGPGLAPVGRQFPGRSVPRPRDRRRGADQASLAPLGPPPGPRSGERIAHVLDRDDLADGPPVHRRGQTTVGRDQGRVGPFVTPAGATEHPVPRGDPERIADVRREGPPARVGPDRAPADLTHPPSGSLSDSEVGRKRRVPARLPGDVRVEPDEPWLPDQVDLRLPREGQKLGEHPRRAPASRTVRVVDPDPDGPASRNRRRPQGRTSRGAPTRAPRGASGRRRGSARAECPCGSARVGRRPA